MRIATLEEVARAAGVSRATASRVVNGSATVGLDARQAVERAIEQLGYVPNRAARSLVTRRSDSIAVVIAEPPGFVFGDPFFADVMRGISAELVARQLQLALLMPTSKDEERRLEQYLTAGHVDGVLLIGLHGDDQLPEHLRTRGIPVVVGGEPPRGVRVSYVDADNRGGAVVAVNHLLAQGRRCVATVTGPLDTTSGVNRRQGWLDALAAAGLDADPTMEASGGYTREGGIRAMESLLERHPEIDGVFVASDHMAAGALQVIQSTGRRVPADVAVIGFDDSWEARSTQPQLSSIRQPIEDLGREIVRLLLQEVTRPDAPPRSVILGTELVVRASSQEVKRP